MATVLLAGTVVTGAGVAVVGATVEVFDRDTTTPVRSTFTGGTDASGDWNFTYAPGANSRRVDVRVTNGASISFLKYDDQIQVSSVETANLRIINPAFTFEYDIVPAAITAARQLNLPLITATRTLVANNTALADNESIIFGTGADASILYDGTNLVVNPQLVGTGVFNLAAGDLRIANNVGLVARNVGDTANIRLILLDASNEIRIGAASGLIDVVLDGDGAERFRFKANSNFGIGTSAFGTSAVGVLSIANGTAPTTGPANTVQFYSSDDSAANTIPSFFCEGSGVLATGQADSASSVRVKVRINGTVVTLLGI